METKQHCAYLTINWCLESSEQCDIYIQWLGEFFAFRIQWPKMFSKAELCISSACNCLLL